VTDGSLLDVAHVVPPESTRRMAKRAMSSLAYERYAAVRLEEITYASNGLRIKGFRAMPGSSVTPSAVGEAQKAEAPLPAIIFNRGGTGPKGALTALSAMSICGLFASWGYVCVASNYRGAGGSEGAEEWGSGDADDAMNLLPLLDAMPEVDSTRIGLIGGSRGGMLALMMLARTNRFRAAITFGAPTMLHATDSAAYIRRTMTKLLPSGAIEQTEAERRSVLLWADQLSKQTPLLVLHGSGDRRVDPEHSLKLAMELQRLHHPYKLIVYDNADHVLAGRRQESYTDMRWWIDNYVRNNAPLPRTGPHGA